MVLTPEESAALLRIHHPAATPTDVAMVVERTEGWAAAVVLAGRLLDRGVPETHDLFRDDGRPVVARLMEQAFGSCPPRAPGGAAEHLPRERGRRRGGRRALG